MATNVIGLDRLKRKLSSFPEIVKSEIKAAMEQGRVE